MGCDCGKPKCDGHCGISPAVLQINNPSECVLFHRVEVPASMGDSKTNPPKPGAYKNVLLYYEADQTSWLYSSDGVPQKLVNGVTNYEDAINLPQINGVTLLGDKTSSQLGIKDLFYINVTNVDFDEGTFTADKTYAEILEAYNAGKLPIVIVKEESSTLRHDGIYMLRSYAVFDEADGFDFVYVDADGREGKVNAGSWTIHIGNNESRAAESYGHVEVDPSLNQYSDHAISNSAVTNALLSRAVVFDTVADMKTATDLVDGSYTRTLGYHAVDDNGAGTYKIISSEVEADEGSLVSLSNGLKARLIIGNFVTPEQFGAYGDGTHDDTAAFTNAIATGKKVLGTDSAAYKITGSIQFSDAGEIVRISGCNILCDFTQSNYLFVGSDTVETFELIGCVIDGNNSCYGVVNRSTGIVDFEMRNCEVHSMTQLLTGNFPTTYAVSVDGQINNIDNCYVHDNGGHGIIMFAGSAYGNDNAIFTINNCKAENNGGTRLGIGIGSYSPVNNAKCTITNCVATGNGASGIAPHGINNNIVDGCHSANNGEHGFVLQQCHDSIISNCIATGNTGFGVRVQGDFSLSENNRFVTNCTVVNNVIDQSKGVSVGVKATNILVKNNTLLNTATPYSTDNSGTGRNVGSGNVVFEGNSVSQSSYTNFAPNDYFDNLIIKDNTNPFTGKMTADGIHRVSDTYSRVFVSTADLSMTEGTDNTVNPNVNNYNGTYSDGVLTTTSDVTEGNYTTGFRFPITDVLTVTINNLPSGLIPVARMRNTLGSLLVDYRVIDYTAGNATPSAYTITVENLDKATLGYVEIGIRAAGGNFTAGTYAFAVHGASGYKVHVV